MVVDDRVYDVDAVSVLAVLAGAITGDAMARPLAARVLVSRPVPYTALPEPMLARAASTLPLGDYAFEVKWDGFRAIVTTEGPLPCGAGAAGT